MNNFSYRPDPSVLKKSGAELYRELLRLNKESEAEDYYKNGRWLDELIRMDINLIFAHRREAGAADPPPLEDIPVPEPPKPKPLPTATGNAIQTPMGLMMRTSTGVMVPANASNPYEGQESGGAPSPALQAIQAKALDNMVVLFIGKHKLDPAKSKALFEPLEAHAKKYVIQNWSTSAVAPAFKMAELEKYMQSKPWPTLATTSKAPMPTSSKAPGKVIKPLSAMTDDELQDLMISKHGMDKTWVEGLLLGLEDEARTYVLKNFRTPKRGDEAVDELEKYISGSPWEAKAAPVPAAATSLAARNPLLGLGLSNRPKGSQLLALPSSSPSFGSPLLAGKQPGALALRPAATPLGVRPTIMTPKGFQSVPAKPGAISSTEQKGQAWAVNAFIGKYNVEASKARQVLNGLKPHELTEVLKGFESTNTGEDAMQDLENYIEACRTLGEWNKEPEGAASSGGFNLMRAPPKRSMPQAGPPGKVPRIIAPTVIPGMRPPYRPPGAQW